MARTAIISDIHGHWDGLQIVCDHINTMQVDRIICLGDVVEGGDYNDQVVTFLKTNNIPTVRGNHDDYNNCNLQPENFQWLKNLPIVLVEESIVFTHISPRKTPKRVSTSIEAWNIFDETDYRLIFIGHNHFPALFSADCDEYANSTSHSVDVGCYSLDLNNRYVICFGAVGYPRGGGWFLRYGIFDDSAQTVEFVKIAGSLLPYGYP